MAFVAVPGGPSVAGPGSRPIRTVSLMEAPGRRLSLQEALHRGVATAHRGICYNHTDLRNFDHRTGGKGSVL